MYPKVPTPRDKRERARKMLMRSGVVVAFVGLTILVGGIIEFVLSERERLHGWDLTICEVITNHGINDSRCIYLTVLYGNESLCSVPGTIASEVWFHEPPACLSNLSPSDRVELERWRAVRSAEVECLVPQNPVPAHQCIETATSGSLGATVWRTYMQRLVYLINNRKEGSDALTSVTAARRGAAIGFVVVGILFMVIGLMSIFFTHWLSFCNQVAKVAPRVGQMYRRRRARDHHLH